MRKALLGLCTIGLFALTAAAQDKVDVQWKCGKATMQHSIDVGDQPGHAYVITQIKCSASKGELAGVKNKDGGGAQFDEAMGNTSKYHGNFVETLANGDKIQYTYAGTANMKNGQIVDGSHKWTAIKGTGKFAGIKTSGSCKGVGAADGSVTWDCEGTYTMGAAAPAKSTPAKKKS